jgi:hypothetical protein
MIKVGLYTFRCAEVVELLRLVAPFEPPPFALSPDPATVFITLALLWRVYSIYY